MIITPEGGRDVRHLRAHGVGRWVKPLASDSVSKPLRRECVLGTAPDTPVSFGWRSKMIMIGLHARESTGWSAEAGAKYR